MKNQFTYLILFLFVIFFSSCSQLSNLSVEKRHYRNGYYISHNTQGKTETSSQNNKQEFSSEKISALKVNETAAEIISATSENKIESDNYYHQPFAKKNHFQSFSEYKKPLRTIKQVSSAIKSHKHDDELSMFWSVILLIVVIWLIAYFTGGWGLGGLINLLLLVALILLILWLLRIL